MALDVQNEDPLPKTHSLVVGLGPALGHDHDSNGNSTCDDDDDDDGDGLVTLELFSTNKNKSSSFSYQAQDRVYNLLNTKVEGDHRRRRRRRQANRFNPSEKNKRYLAGFLKTMSQRRNGNNNNNNSNINVPQPKLDLRLNLSPPRPTAAAAGEGGRRLIMAGPDSPARSASLSPPSSCLSSELINDQAAPVKYSSSPEATSMVLVGCPRCLMYVMLSEDDPKCPKCKSTVLLDFLRDNNATTTAANNNQSAAAAKRTRKS